MPKPTRANDRFRSRPLPFSAMLNAIQQGTTPAAGLRDAFAIAAERLGCGRISLYRAILAGEAELFTEWTCDSAAEPHVAHYINISDHMLSNRDTQNDVRRVVGDACGDWQWINPLAQSAIALPIWYENQFLGFVCFEDWERMRKWSRAEEQAMGGIAAVTAPIMSQLRVTAQQAQAQQSLWRILDCLDGQVYISDMQTDELLYSRIGSEPNHIDHRRCWEVVRQNDQHCHDCPCARLDPNGESWTGERYDVNTQQWWQSTSRVVRWLDGRDVHLCVIHDVTAIKTAHEVMQRTPVFDSTSQAFNRMAGMAVLENLIRQGRRAHTPLCGCFVDLADLEGIIAKYGHQEAERSLTTVGDAVTGIIRESDVLCRLSDDSYLVVFINCQINDAHRIMSRVQVRLDEINTQGYPVRLRYGIEEYDYHSNPNVNDFVAAIDKLKSLQQYV